MIERTARIAAPAAVALFAFLGLLMTREQDELDVAAALIASLAGVVLAWWRVTGWPLAAGMVVPVAAYVVLGHGQSANLAFMGLCVVAVWVALVSPVVVAVTAGVGLIAVPVLQFVSQSDEPGWASWSVGIVFSTVACIFARRLRETVEQLRAAQSELAERTRAEERDRIAADVHDILGHALTVSLLHISSARLALDEDRAEAERSLGEAERVTRDSLEEVRATVGLMRTDTPGEVRPLPDAGDIEELVASFRRAGSEVELTVAGDLASLGATRGLTAYRIVQEALTNAAKHAPGEPVAVRVDVADGAATVTVRNGGHADPAAVPGSGLRGMRERAESVGGRLTAGAAAPGWAVEAVLPS